MLNVWFFSFIWSGGKKLFLNKNELHLISVAPRPLYRPWMPCFCRSSFAICVADTALGADITGPELYERLSTVFVTASFVGEIITGFCCWAAWTTTTKKTLKTLQIQKLGYRMKYLLRYLVVFLPILPASCSWILSISMGVVTITWHMPAPHPASISLNTVKPFLLTENNESDISHDTLNF